MTTKASSTDTTTTPVEPQPEDAIIAGVLAGLRPIVQEVVRARAPRGDRPHGQERLIGEAAATRVVILSTRHPYEAL